MVKRKVRHKRKYRIAISDDDPILISNYRRVLELSGYDVEFYSFVDEVVELVSTEIRPIDLFVIDIVQPPGKSFASKPTENGMYTGLYLAHYIRQKMPKAPIILFSIASLPSLRKAAEQLTDNLDECILLKKGETMPTEFLEIINHYFDEFSLASTQKHSIFKRLFRSLMLQPNISGVGIDLKELGKQK